MKNEQRKTKKHFLLTNDDGVGAPGLLKLAQAVRPYGDVTILAPSRDWSGAGRYRTFKDPLRISETQLADGTPALTTNGSPADCAALALMGAVARPVDLILSGINSSANLSHDVTCSGTVGAVLEGMTWGVPGIAFSLDVGRNRRQDYDYTLAVHVVEQVLAQVARHGLPADTFLNVNVPYLPLPAFRGIQVTRLGMRIYRDRLEKRYDPRGNHYYWIGGEPPSGIPEEGTDVGAIATGYASVTPLQLDMSQPTAVAELAQWAWSAATPEQTVWQWPDTVSLPAPPKPLSNGQATAVYTHPPA